jgi:hypothetical protein
VHNGKLFLAWRSAALRRHGTDRPGKYYGVFGGLTPNEHILRYPIPAYYFIAAAVRSLSINAPFRSIPHLYPPSAPVPRMTR